MAYARPSTIQDCFALSLTMRRQDVEELQASSGDSPLIALLKARRVSKWCLTIEHKGEVVGMFGLAQHPTHSHCGVPWLLGSPVLKKIAKTFLKESPDYVGKMLQEYPVLMNFVDERNTASIRWLKWLGFFPYRHYPRFGVEERPFILYVRYDNV